MTFAGWVREQPCAGKDRLRRPDWLQFHPKPVYHRCAGEVRACHGRTRGAGGKTRANLYPGCDQLHHEQHTWGQETFCQRYAFGSLKDLCLLYWRTYLAERKVRRSLGLAS